MDYVYKIVRKVGDKFISAAQNNWPSTEYILYKWSYPSYQGSCLFAFRTLDDTKNCRKRWGWNTSNYYIMKCVPHCIVTPKTFAVSCWIPQVANQQTLNDTVFVLALQPIEIVDTEDFSIELNEEFIYNDHKLKIIKMNNNITLLSLDYNELWAHGRITIPWEQNKKYNLKDLGILLENTVTAEEIKKISNG